MARTVLRTEQIKDSTINVDDIDTSTVGKALVTKIAQGTNLSITSTGGDAGTGQVTINVDGTFATAAKNCCINYVLDGNGAVIPTGLQPYISIPFSMTITGWILLADQTGSIEMDVWKSSYASFPPTITDTISGSELPTITSSNKNRDLTLSTWTTSISSGDILAINVNSCSSITKATLIIVGNKT